ncbi:MAG: PASTA domain-containing protein [Eubacteriales bacterium]|nr:PASTA domain-containing protein [Eubacteriales bacterium]
MSKKKKNHAIRNWILTCLATIVLVAGIMLAAVYVLFPDIASQIPVMVKRIPDRITTYISGETEQVEEVPASAQVEVPDLYGMTERHAKLIANGLGLGLKFEKEILSNDKPGVVMEQTPKAGTMVEKNTTIYYATSVGPADVLVPNVVGSKAADAVRTLLEMGFDSIVTEYNRNGNGNEGQVLSCSPAVNERVNTATHVTLVISAGTDTSETLVPDTIGYSEQEALADVEQAGLIPIIEYGYSNREQGTVLKQSIQKNNTINKGSELLLTISNGQMPEKGNQKSMTLEQPDTAVGGNYYFVYSQIGSDGKYVEEWVEEGTDAVFPYTIHFTDFNEAETGTVRFYEQNADGTYVPRAYWEES